MAEAAVPEIAIREEPGKKIWGLGNPGHCTVIHAFIWQACLYELPKQQDPKYFDALSVGKMYELDWKCVDDHSAWFRMKPLAI